MLRAMRRTPRPATFDLFKRSLNTSSGLFGVAGLHSPEDWTALVTGAQARCLELVDQVTSSTGEDAIRATDQLSDTICQVYDAAELCRNVHAEAEWRSAAEAACTTLGGFMADLNVHPGLYHSVATAVRGEPATGATSSGSAGSGGSGAASSGVTQQALGGGAAGGASMSAAALRTGHLLCQDFEMQGVHLDAGDQKEFKASLAREQQLCMQFGVTMADPDSYPIVRLEHQTAAAAGLLRKGMGRQGNMVLVPSHASALDAMMTQLPRRVIRRQALTRCMEGPVANREVLDEIMAVRRRIADLLGFPSFAHYQASHDTVAGRPEATGHFLRQLAVDVAPRAREEVSLLTRYNGGSPPQAWDELHLRHLALGSQPTVPLCTLQEALAALSEISSRLFSLRIQPAPLSPGEGWADSVQKLALLDASDGSTQPLGHLYLDLYNRRGKVAGAGVQYTLRSGRQLPDGEYQKPLAALVCNFPADPAAHLTAGAVNTLFHEFGHVLNVLLNTTEFQHVAGTRGASDTVEVASQLLEYLAGDTRVFRGPLAAAALEQQAHSETTFSALDILKQVFHSRLDQELHGKEPPRGAAAVELARDLAADTLPWPLTPAACPQARFTHLATTSMQGSKYYSYLYSKCFAAAAWRRHLAADPFDAAAGAHVRRTMLEVGISVPPHQMIADLLGPTAVQPAEGGLVPCTQDLLAELGV